MDKVRSIPRIVIAGISSGSGKTTFTVALCRALMRRGLRVAAFKAGPDYLDPTYHARATGRTSQNLDAWMMGREAVQTTLHAATQDADIAIVEGVMGLFDGTNALSDEGSTAQIAKWIEAPVLLVVDAGGMARTIAAVVHGCSTFDAELRVAGVIGNRVGSKHHLQILRDALTDVPCVGGMPKEPGLSFPERHLGLRTADRNVVTDEQLDAWADRVEQWCEVDRILEMARSAPALTVGSGVVSGAAAVAARCSIAYALDEAFHFYYEDNLQRLRSLGVELVPFSPIHDACLPDVDGVYLGGGYPEVHAQALSANGSMRDALQAFVSGGGPVYAECGGLMYLTEGIRTLEGDLHPMVGLVAAEAVMRDRMQALGYVEVKTERASLLGDAGVRVRGHQFRYSELQWRAGASAGVYQVTKRRNGAVEVEGYQPYVNVLASYVHVHWASNPAAAEALVEACVAYAERRHESDVQEISI